MSTKKKVAKTKAPKPTAKKAVEKHLARINAEAPTRVVVHGPDLAGASGKDYVTLPLQVRHVHAVFVNRALAALEKNGVTKSRSAWQRDLILAEASKILNEPVPRAKPFVRGPDSPLAQEAMRRGVPTKQLIRQLAQERLAEQSE